MTDRAIEPEQRTAARVAGLLFLLMMVTGVFAEMYARGRLIVPGDAAQTARNIAASERLFRLGAVSNLLTFAGDVILVLSLYVVLKRIDRKLALLATFWRLAECALFPIIVLCDFVTLRLLSGAGYLRALDTQQLQALAQLSIGVHGDGYGVGGVFFALGSTVFAWLWWRSRYIPRGLAAWGVFSSLLLLIVMPTVMVIPSLAAVFIPVCFAPIFIFEVTLGVWLLTKGLRVAVAK